MKKAVCALLQKDGLILGVSRKDDPNSFGLPGGKVDPGETLQEACIREIWEETGITISNLVHVYTRLCEGETDYETAVFTADFHLDGMLKGASPEETGIIRWMEPRDFLTGPFAEYNGRLFEYMGLL